MLALAVVAVLISLAGLWLAAKHLKHLRDRMPSEPKAVVHSSRWWRLRTFEQGVHYLNEYIGATPYVAAIPETKTITHDDVRAWGRSVMLTAAASISRYSQGKANLFVVNDVVDVNGARCVTLRAKQFVGAFPISQLTTIRTEDPVYNYRDMRVTDQSNATIAAAAAYQDRVVFEPIGDAVSDAERSLGTTHILAIPICSTIAAVQSGDAAVVTVDFRLPRRVRILWICESWVAKGKVLRRANLLQVAMRNFAQALAGGGANDSDR